jgi:FeS assembly SUF system protein
MTPEELLEIETNIVLVLKNVYDPEITVNIYDLGLIYDIDVEPDGTANITMTLTAPNCPMADILLKEVNDQVGQVKGVSQVKIDLTFEPQWNQTMMSDEAKLELGFM